MKRLVTRPPLLRPPDLRLPTTSDFLRRFLCDVLARHARGEAACRGCRTICLYRHGLDLRVLRHLLARREADIRFLPVRTVPGEAAATAEFAEIVDRLHVRDLHAEHLLNGSLDLGLVRVRRNFEAQRAGFVLLAVTAFSVTIGRRITSYTFIQPTPPRASGLPLLKSELACTPAGRTPSLRGTARV